MLISLGLFEEGTVLTREMEKKYTDFMLQHLGPYGFSKCQASSVSEAQRKESLLLTHKKASFLLLSASWPLPLEA